MLYLVKLDNVYKIGFSDSIETRIKSFETTHVEIKLIASGEGTIQDEKQLHKICSEFHIKGELFEINDRVVELFKLYLFDNYSNQISQLKKLLQKEKEKVNNILLTYNKMTELFKRLLIYFTNYMGTEIEFSKMNTELLTQGNNFLKGITNTYIEICQHK